MPREIATRIAPGPSPHPCGSWRGIRGAGECGPARPLRLPRLALERARPGDPGSRTRSKPLWPVVLWGLVLPLLLLDLFVRRISFGVRRVEV